MPVVGTCPSQKRSFPSKRAAKDALRAIRKGDKRNGRARPRHVYKCGLCPWWHMTSQKQHATGDGLGKCRACPAEILWAQMPSGKANPLDLEPVPCEPRRGVVAFDPRDGTGTPVTIANVDELRGGEGLTFHVSHFATCPARQRFKRGES